MADKKASVLNSKLTALYGKSPEAVAYIEREVSKFLASRSGNKAMTASEIQNFQSKVEKGVKQLEESRAKEEKSAGGESKMAEAAESKVKEENVPLSYLVYGEASSLEFEEIKRQERRRIEERKQELKQQLDEQIAEKQHYGGQNKAIDAEYSETVLKRVAEHHAETAQKARTAKQEMAILKQKRDEQLEDLRKRRERERLRNAAEERAMLENARVLLKKEEDKQKQAVRDRMSYNHQMMAENEENKRIRRAHELQLQEESRQQEKEMNRIMDAQMEARTKAFDAIKAKSSQNQAMFLVATAEKDQKDREDEAKALAFQKEKIQRDLEAQANDIRKIAQAKEELRSALSKQVEDKKRRDEETAKSKTEFVGVFLENAERFKREAKEEERKRAKANLEHRLELQRQIAEKQSRVDETSTSVMTEAEKRLNKQAIAVLLDRDPAAIPIINSKLEKARKVEEAKNRRKLGIRGGPADIALDEDDF